MKQGCGHYSMHHSKCNACLVFSCLKVVIEFHGEIVRFVYIFLFLVYHGNM